MPQPHAAVSGRSYTVIGYLELFNIHTVYEHVEAQTTDEAIERVRHKLEYDNFEYRIAMQEDVDPLTVIAVFNGHLDEND
jgi:hypothetical protein